jgi:hypothetical protein
LVLSCGFAPPSGEGFPWGAGLAVVGPPLPYPCPHNLLETVSTRKVLQTWAAAIRVDCVAEVARRQGQCRVVHYCTALVHCAA